jgi:hypothetical protein
MSGRTVLNFAFGVAVSAAVLYGFWHWFGAFGLVYGMPVLAICAAPLLDLTGALSRLVARLPLRRYEGRYYAFRGRHVDIDVDVEATCWVATADARKILVSLPADAVLERLQPDGVGLTGDPRLWRITPQALAAVLAKSGDPQAARFLRWLDGEVVQPAAKKRARRMPIR